MGDLPIDNTGCFVKVTFPKDMPLPSAALAAYQSDEKAQMRMLESPTNGFNLKRSDPQEVFTSRQGFAPDGTGNYVVVKGCQLSSYVGTSRNAFIKFTTVTTPAA